MHEIMVGRKAEQQILHQALSSKEAELVAVIGRRRIGKTFLVYQSYQPYIRFEVAGLQNATRKRQLKNFWLRLQSHFPEVAKNNEPSDWLEAFHHLGMLLDQNPTQDGGKHVLFFDELPWLDNRKSGFLEAFGNWWNVWASRRQVVVVVCGSSASWMVQKVVQNKGGLHNRITKNIWLQPFSLAETEAYLQSRNVHLDRYHILQIYMATGGVPHYLKAVQGGMSAAQNLEQMAFSAQAILRDEFEKLYPALFENPENHVSIVRALAAHHTGLSRARILEYGKLSNGGSFSRFLSELEQSGFITQYQHFGKQTKESIYRLTDAYTLFYLNFIEQRRQYPTDTWTHLSQTQTYKVWCGYAFENICLKHSDQIKQALGISGVYTEVSAFLAKPTATNAGVQIDLLFDRNDRVINLFELKFYTEVCVFSKTEVEALREKIRLFKAHTKTQKQVFLSVIAPMGVRQTPESSTVVDHGFGMEVLFA
jgi:uncharacterized protein